MTMEWIKSSRGLSGGPDTGGFAMLMGQFNAANIAARGGDMDVAKTLPGLSQSLLNAAALMATSRQELNRVQAQTAASLEANYAAVNAITRSEERRVGNECGSTFRSRWSP